MQHEADGMGFLGVLPDREMLCAACRNQGLGDPGMGKVAWLWLSSRPGVRKQKV